MNARPFVIVFIVSALLPALLAGGFMYAVDPYQHYRKSDLLFGNMRYTAPGMARHWDYDIMVTGTSLSQNFRPSVVERELGAPAVNLSLSGSTLHAQKTLVETAARNGKPRTIIWELQYGSATGAVDRLRGDKAFPRFLYDDNPFNDVNYLFNLDTLKNGWSKLRHPEWHTPPSMDVFNAWYFRPANRTGRENVLRKYTRPAASSDFVPHGKRLPVVARSFEANMLATIRAHPEIEFIIFIPPRSLLFQVSNYIRTPSQFQAKIDFYRYAFRLLVREPNVRLFYFDLETRVTGNLDNYKDTSHYGVHISDAILFEFARNGYRVTPANYDDLLDRFTALVATTDLDSLIASPAGSETSAKR